MENDKTLKPSYFSVTPAEVRYSKDLPDGAKLLYGEITALSNKHGYCFASNAYLAELYDNDIRTVQRWIGQLQKHGFVNVMINGKSRRIYPIVASKHEAPPLTEDDEPIEEEAPAPAKKSAKKKTPKEKKVRVTVKFEMQDMQLAQLLRDRSITNFPHLENKKTDLEKWANEIRLLRQHLEESDKEDEKKGKPLPQQTPFERIEFMIVWVQGGTLTRNGRSITLPPEEFWHSNILSADKLRKQWDGNLMPKMEKWKRGIVKKHAAADLSAPPRGTRQPEQVAQL